MLAARACAKVTAGDDGDDENRDGQADHQSKALAKLSLCTACVGAQIERMMYSILRSYTCANIVEAGGKDDDDRDG